MEAINPLQMLSGNNRGFAKLLLYSPRFYGNQVLRPFIYGFTEDATNKLLGCGDTLTKSFDREDVANSEAIANVIKPASEGTELDMSGYQQCWTFTLVINRPNNFNGGAFAARGSQTTIISGHCAQDPVSAISIPGSENFNMDCPLIVHSREMINDGSETINAYGMHTPTDIICADDVLDPSMDQMAKDRNLYKMTPQDVLMNYGMTAGEVVQTEANCAMCNADRVPIQMALKSPGTHLRQILQGLDTQNETVKLAELSPRGAGSLGAINDVYDVDQYKTGVGNQLGQMSVGCMTQTNGIDVTGVFTIGDVARVYPDVTIITQRLPMYNQIGDIIPQATVDPQVQYSSMVSSATAAIAADCGLSSISFQYVSHDPAHRNDLDKSSFQVVPENTYLSSPPGDQETYNQVLVAAVSMFRMRFKKEVAPFILGVVGDFAVQVIYSINSETMVKLHLLENNLTNFLDGWTEAPNRLSSLSTTSVGNVNDFQNNGHALNEFVLQVNGKTSVNAMGLPAFDMPQHETNPLASVQLFT